MSLAGHLVCPTSSTSVLCNCQIWRFPFSGSVFSNSIMQIHVIHGDGYRSVLAHIRVWRDVGLWILGWVGTPYGTCNNAMWAPCFIRCVCRLVPFPLFFGGLIKCFDSWWVSSLLVIVVFKVFLLISSVDPSFLFLSSALFLAPLHLPTLPQFLSSRPPNYQTFHLLLETHCHGSIPSGPHPLAPHGHGMVGRWKLCLLFRYPVVCLFVGAAFVFNA